MKMRKKLVFAVVLFYLIVIFIPKENFYYFAESYLKKYDFVLNNEDTSDILGFFNVNNATMSYKNNDIGNIKNIFVFPAIFYNQININDINFNAKIKQFFPKTIKKLSIKNTIFYPTKAWISGYGKFGEISGSINFYTKMIKLQLKPTKSFLNTHQIRNFKKIKDMYIYETTYK